MSDAEQLGLGVDFSTWSTREGGGPARLGKAAAVVVGGLLAFAGLTGCGSDGVAQPGLQAATTEATAETPAAKPAGPSSGQAGPAPETTRYAAQWPAPGRDLGNSRASTESSITAATVDRLEVAWTVPLFGNGIFGNASSSPIVLGDTVLVQDLNSNLQAVDLQSGEVRWTSRYDTLTTGPNGPAAGYGKVFAVEGMSGVVAVDLETGKEVWSTKLTKTDTDGIDIQPQVYGGLVFASTIAVSLKGQFVGGDRGILYALDAETGEVRWTFDTVKGDDLWGDPSLNSGGGSWYPPAVDPETGLIYFGTANPAPFPGTAEYPNGSSRPGPNLYTDSVLALDAATGKLRWYYQAIEHDLFDLDMLHTMVVPLPGSTPSKVVVASGKMGRIIGLDPETGEKRWDTEVGDHQNDHLTQLDGPTTVLPGTYGGVETPPAWADGVVYAAVVNAPSTLSPDEVSYLGTEFGKRPGTMVAVDATDGSVLWSTPIDGDPLGGAVVAGDLVFTGTQTGTIIAFDRATGEEVWHTQAPGGLNAWAAVVGDTLLWPVGSAEPPQLVAYRLG